MDLSSSKRVGITSFMFLRITKTKLQPKTIMPNIRNLLGIRILVKLLQNYLKDPFSLCEVMVQSHIAEIYSYSINHPPICFSHHLHFKMSQEF